MKERECYAVHDSIGYWVNRLAMAMRAAFERELAPYGVTSQQAAILITCFRGQAETPMTFAKILDIDCSAVTRLLDRLEAKGLLVRRCDPSDRRCQVVELTESGCNLAPKLIPASQSVTRKFLKGIPGAEAGQFRKTLMKMLRNADQ